VGIALVTAPVESNKVFDEAAADLPVRDVVSAVPTGDAGSPERRI